MNLFAWYLLFSMQQAYPIFGDFQFLRNDSLQILHRYLAVDADREAAAGRRVHI